MRTIKSSNLKAVVRTKSIEHLWVKYCKQLNINPTIKPTLKQSTELFVLVIREFKKRSVSLDELSGFGNCFFDFATQNKDSDFFEAALAASELTFAIRTPNLYRCIQDYLEDIDWFYNVHTGRIPTGSAKPKPKTP